jgi:hypothetical protein
VAECANFEQIPIGQTMFVKHPSIGLFNRQIKPLKVGMVLIGAGFVGVLDDAKVKEIRIAGLNSGQIE